ncbi:MAG: hypothetical protein KR126chlam1_01318 [Chlamydiae bacterium]|nr:hypothetical protein [Chlamydiota bacterium]
MATTAASLVNSESPYLFVGKYNSHLLKSGEKAQALKELVIRYLDEEMINSITDQESYKAALKRGRTISGWGLSIMNGASKARYVKSVVGFGCAALENLISAIVRLVGMIFYAPFTYSQEGRASFASHGAKAMMNISNTIFATVGVVAPPLGSWYTKAAINYVAPPATPTA